ncbi:MAG: hypothetical protein WAW09_09115 [Smithella sp.]
MNGIEMGKRQNYEERWPNLDIHYLILSTNDFIVFIDSDIDVDWETSDDYDKRGHENLTKHNAILNRAASLECIPNAHQSNQIRLNFKRMIAEGVARSLKHDYDNADKMLNEAELYIRNRNIETARFWQLTSSCICGVVSLIFVLVLWSFRNGIIELLGSTAFYVLVGAVSGSIGSTLSIILRMGRSKITSEAERKLHILEAVSKNLGGCISGLIISLLIKMGVVVPIFESVKMTNIAMIAGAFIAGASERWAPSLISQFEKGTSYKKKGDA